MYLEIKKICLRGYRLDRRFGNLRESHVGKAADKMVADEGGLQSVEGISLIQITALKPFFEPVHTLLGGAMRKGIGHHIAL